MHFLCWFETTLKNCFQSIALTEMTITLALVLFRTAVLSIHGKNMVVASAISAPFSVNYRKSHEISIRKQTFKSLKMKTRSVSRRRAAPDTEGLKTAQEVAHEVEETLG